MSKLFNETFGSGASKSGIERELIKRGIPIFNSLCRSYLPELSIIPEFRQLQTAKGENPLDGSGLIETLATWQHPDIGSEAMRVRFDAISGFVTELLGMQNAHLEILHSRDTIVLETNGLRLPLSSFGTGVHQLLILVSALISNENALVCVEEPDTHLHPRLQRALVKFMLQHTTNTYLVATHSPALINIANSEPQAKTFHLTLGVDGTRGAPILTQKHIRDVIQDLGVLPSDLVQANAIIWVEGPSDCVYIRHWLNLIDPSLSEGRDFTFASYDGGQLAHFNFDAADVDDLINVLHISQRTILVVDRDRDDDKSAIASQKQKAIAASAAQGGFGWTTHGRAIENYIPATVVNRACQEVLNVSVDFTYSQFKDFGQSFVSALRRAGVKNVDWHEPKAKVRWARRFMAQFTEADLQPELRSTLNTIVSQLRRWNY